MRIKWMTVLMGLPLVMAGVVLGGVINRPQAEVAQARLPIAAMEGVQVYAGAPAGEERVYFTREQLLQGGLMLVSPQHPLPEDFPLPNARGVQAVVGAYFPSTPDAALTYETIQALCDMHMEHALDGMRVALGAVSSAQQNALRREAFARYSQVYTMEQAAALSRQNVPGGGESEHQLGTAFDIQLTGTLEMGKHDLIAQSGEGLWLRDNMWRYGFIRRYSPGHAGNEEGTCENLHLRYVGKIHAAIMQAGGWCLEEYLAVLAREGTLTLCMDGQKDVYVYWMPCGEGDGMTVSLPHTSARGSLDNLGGAVFTCTAQ